MLGATFIWMPHSSSTFLNSTAIGSCIAEIVWTKLHILADGTKEGIEFEGM